MLLILDRHNLVMIMIELAEAAFKEEIVG